jgi:small subunit ribosomal protein S16
MALRIKLARGGSAHNPIYRIVVGEARVKRDGKFVEWIGTYSPKAARGQLKLNLDRADYWIGVGAKPTDTVRSLINKARRTPVEEVEGNVPEPIVEVKSVGDDSAPVLKVPAEEKAAPVETEAAAAVKEAEVAEEQPTVVEAPVAEAAPEPEVVEAPAEAPEEESKKATEAAAEEEAPAPAEEAEASEEKKDA